MPFKEVDIDKEIEERCKESPEFAEAMKKAKQEYEDIKSGKIKGKFGDRTNSYNKKSKR